MTTWFRSNASSRLRTQANTQEGVHQDKSLFVDIGGGDWGFETGQADVRGRTRAEDFSLA
jgi:hypothetical protein